MDGTMWAAVFGGGTKVVIPSEREEASDVIAPKESPKSGVDGQRRDTTRMKWNYKLLGKDGTPPPTSRNQNLARHEIFIQPQMSLCDYFLKKVL